MDGWFPQFPPGDEGRQAIARLTQYVGEAGRDPGSLGMEARINVSDGSPEAWLGRARSWEDLGATHVSVNTMRAGLGSPDAHIDAIRQFKEVEMG